MREYTLREFNLTNGNQFIINQGTKEEIELAKSKLEEKNNKDKEYEIWEVA